MTYPAGRSAQTELAGRDQPGQVSANARLDSRRHGAGLSRQAVSWNHQIRAGSLGPLFPCGNGVAWIPLGQKTLGESGTMF